MAQYTEPWESVYRALRSENLGAPTAAGGRLLSEDESPERSTLSAFYGRIAPENERFYNHIQGNRMNFHRFDGSRLFDRRVNECKLPRFKPTFLTVILF